MFDGSLNDVEGLVLLYLLTMLSDPSARKFLDFASRPTV